MKKRLLAAFICISSLQGMHAQIGGSLDPSFGNAGKVIKSLNPGADKAYGVALLPDGSFLIAGSTYSAARGNDFFCVKFTDNGALDNTFGISGSITTDLQLGSEDVALSIAYDETTGKFVLAGSSSNGTKQFAALVRYNANGTRDSTFGVNGIVLQNLQGNNDADAFRKVRIHALTGNLITVGNSILNSTDATAFVTRYLSDGRPDSTFNGNGISKGIGVWWYNDLKDVYVAPSGKITATGNTTDRNLNFLYEGLVVKLNANGTMDSTFGAKGDGYAVQDYMGKNNGMYLDPGTGKIYVAGGQVAYFGSSNRNERMALKRVEANGSDDSWAYAGLSSGYFTTINGNEAYANTMCATPGGQFFIAGAGYNSSSNLSAGMIMKLDFDGWREPTFGEPLYGTVMLNFGSNNMEIFDMVQQPDDKIVIVGFTGNDAFIARLFGSTVPALDSFRLVSPANNTTGLICDETTLDWTDAPGATGYDAFVDTSLAFSNPDVVQTAGSDAQQYELSLEIGKTYYWKVRAYNSTDTGAWVGPWKFSTTDDIINLLSPADGAVDVSVAATYLDWTDVPAPTQNFLQFYYQFELSTSPSFSASSSGTDDPSNTTLNDMLDYNTTYYWHVRSKRGINKYGPWSTTFSFTTGSPLGIGEVASNALYVYPNPAGNTLYLGGEQSATIAKVSIQNTLGAIMRNEPVKDNHINVADLAPGVYFLHATTNNGTVIRRFVKE